MLRYILLKTPIESHLFEKMLSISLKSLFLATSLSVIVVAAPSFHRTKSTVNAIYFLTNDQSNAVVALPVGADGKLSQGSVTPAGGKGGNSINGATNEPEAPDALIGQSALTVAGNVRCALIR